MYTQEDLANAIAILSDADLEDNEIDQIDEIVICSGEEKQELEGIIDAEEEGGMSEDEADEAIAAIIVAHAEKKLEVFGLEIDLEEVGGEEYSGQGGDLISFSQAMGTTISDLIEQDYNNPTIGKQAIANATGLSLGDVDQIILGQVVPDQQTANNIAACFSATQDGEGYQQFVDLASNAIAEVAEFSSNGADSNKPSLATFQNTSEINTLRAEFGAIQQEKELGNSLRVLEKRADILVQSGRLEPWEKIKLFGNYSTQEDGVALFSAACEVNKTPIATQLDRVGFYLSFAEDRGQHANFMRPEDNFQVVPQEADPKATEYAEGFISRNPIV